VFDDKAVLITGGTGSFGKHFIRALLRRYRPGWWSIRATSSSSSRCSRLPQSRIRQLRFFLGDVRDPRACAAPRRHRHRRARGGAQAGAGGRVQPLRVHQDQRAGRAERDRGLLDTGVQRVVALSTDKAAAPINLYGATKLCSDKLFVAANNIKRHARPALFGGALRQRDGQPRLGDPVLRASGAEAACCRSPTRR
jgi:UDP-N-acetylglucosamine 4,6-dehydratase